MVIIQIRSWTPVRNKFELALGIGGIKVTLGKVSLIKFFFCLCCFSEFETWYKHAVYGNSKCLELPMQLQAFLEIPYSRNFLRRTHTRRVRTEINNWFIEDYISKVMASVSSCSCGERHFLEMSTSLENSLLHSSRISSNETSRFSRASSYSSTGNVSWKNHFKFS